MTALIKYLNHYAEPEIQQLKPLQNRQLEAQPIGFQQGLVIPVYRESTAVIDRFADFAEKQTGSLIVMVINRPDTDPDTDWAKALLAHPRLHADTFRSSSQPLSQPSSQSSQQPSNLQWQSTQQQLNLYYLNHAPVNHQSINHQSINQRSAILLVDRCIHGPAIPSNQGVGLARKIGADILCQLIHWGVVTSPWIANTDADAWLPQPYFSVLKNISKTAAVLYPYEHLSLKKLQATHTLSTQATNQETQPSVCEESPTQRPTLLYEFSLHYYVCGLSWADSPYAFHTLGSTIAVDYQHYAKVRGFPKRAAAEDFYLLNKVAKTGTIKTLEYPLIQLQARASTRVPFGTGPAVNKLATNTDPLSMPLYHPDSFLYLRFFLQWLAQLAISNNDAHRVARQLLAQSETHTATGQTASCQAIHQTINLPLLLDIAETLKLPQALAHSFRHGKDATTRQQHLQHWFDGFKTLKLIHLLRDRHLGTITFRDWLNISAAEPSNPLSKSPFPNNNTMNDLIQRIKTTT